MFPGKRSYGVNHDAPIPESLRVILKLDRDVY